MEGNLIGLDYNSVQTVIELHNIEVNCRKYVFDQILKCFYWSVEIMKEQKPEGT